MGCDGFTCKGKETFKFAAGACGGSEGQKIMYAGFTFHHFSEKGGCAYLRSVCLIGGIFR